jgi:hypothetical protein
VMRNGAENIFWSFSERQTQLARRHRKTNFSDSERQHKYFSHGLCDAGDRAPALHSRLDPSGRFSSP